MEAYDVDVDGELKEIKVNDSALIKDKVLLLVDDNDEKIYIWKGIEANVRKRFIATRHASGIRLKKGLEYKIESIDQDEEPNSFLALINKPLKIKPAVEDVPKKALDNSIEPSLKQSTIERTQRDETTARIPEKSFARSSRSEETPASEHATLFETTGPVRPPERPRQVVFHSEETNGKLQKTISHLKKMNVPLGYRREVILIGHELYAVIERRHRFFGKDTIERDIEKLADPPEGIFFAADYIPRVIIQNGEVMAIEFLKLAETPLEAQAAVDATKEDSGSHLSELVGFFQKLGKSQDVDETI